MKTTRFILGLAVPVLTAWVVRAKVPSERVPDAPDLATYIKIAYKPIVKWSANRILKGRYLDRVDLNKGRFNQTDIDRVLENTWHNYDELAPTTHVERLKTLGNRHNVLLGVLTHALYRALLDVGLEKGYVTELVSDLMWKAYEQWIGLPRAFARLTTQDPQEQMNKMLNMFLRYPFNPPGYDCKILAKTDVFVQDVYRFPVYEYFKSHSKEEFMLNTWCTQDFALAQVMTEGGSYERSHTLAAGDKVCDMKWYGKPRS
ncbi:MAG: hypothetical protein IBX69_05620 [Anaerolineales bacterium]|nr:hypothetical protein [Anaerolineales bacterium]